MRIPFIQPIILNHPSQLNISWAQRIINQNHKGVKVNQVDCISIDIGTTTRIQLKVDHNGAETLPRFWFIKIPSLSWRARSITALPRLLQTEVRFYNELAHETPVKKPEILAAKSITGIGSILVLNDLSEQGSIPGKPSDTLTQSQALLVIEQLAQMHAHYWGKVESDPDYQWLAGSVGQLENHLGTALAVPLMKRGLSRAGIIVPKTIRAPTLRYARRRRKIMDFLSTGPQTIIHHDCHPGNLYWNDNQPGLLDWQMIRMGEGISDLAYFISTSLEPSVRRNCETELIKHYLQCLANHGIQDIDFNQAESRYRAHLIYPFEAMIVTLAIGSMMDLNANLKLIGRAVSAIEENNAFAELPL